MSVLRELATLRGWRRILKERLYGLFWIIDHEPAEIAAGGLAASWGIGFLMPWDSFHTGYGGRLATAYTVMASMLPETVWGAIFLLCGLAQLLALLFDHITLRRFFALQTFALWAFVSILFFQANYRQISIFTFPLVAAGSGWAYLRLKWRT